MQNDGLKKYQKNRTKRTWERIELLLPSITHIETWTYQNLRMKNYPICRTKICKIGKNRGSLKTSFKKIYSNSNARYIYYKPSQRKEAYEIVRKLFLNNVIPTSRQASLGPAILDGLYSKSSTKRNAISCDIK